MTEPIPSWPTSSPELPFFSPERPKVGDRPQLLRPDGTPTNTILPSLCITPNADGTFTLWGFFHMGGSSSSPKFVTFSSLQDLVSAYDDWLACPEKFAVTRMGWWPRDKAPLRAPSFSPPSRPAMTVLTLDDL